MLREREPKLEELLTHPAIAIVADPGGGKSVVARAALGQITASGERVPVFGEVKQYRGDLQTLFRITAPAEVLEPAATIDGVLLRRTYLLDGIDEIPTELLQRLGGELREFIAREPQGHFICTARQALYVANRGLLPSIPAVFHILPLADDDIEQYASRAGLNHERFKEAIQAARASEEVRNPFILAVMVERFRAAGQLSKLRSDNLNYMIDRLIQSRPQVNAHRQRRALRMLGVAMETYSRNELTEVEALRVIREAYRIILHGVYTLPYFVNPTAARKTGCTDVDIELLKQLIPYAYAHTASYLRPMVTIRHAWHIEHKSPLGSCPDFALIDPLTPEGVPHVVRG
jgi:hypothetical protein